MVTDSEVLTCRRKSKKVRILSIKGKNFEKETTENSTWNRKSNVDNLKLRKFGRRFSNWKLIERKNFALIRDVFWFISKIPFPNVWSRTSNRLHIRSILMTSVTFFILTFSTVVTFLTLCNRYANWGSWKKVENLFFNRTHFYYYYYKLLI